MEDRDILLFGGTNTGRTAALMSWAAGHPELHDFYPDNHRLILEHWIWSNRTRLVGCVLDVGVDNPRRWLGSGYRTIGLNGEDLAGDLRALPVATASLDAMIVTEVLEHCADPFAAMREIERVLRPGGLLFVTSPFMWCEHGVDGKYKDFWRFTRDGWELLLKRFVDVRVDAVPWTVEGEQAYDFMRRFECMGLRAHTSATTGYLCEARKV